MQHDPELSQEYVRRGWWSDRSLSLIVRERAETHPQAPVYIDDQYRWTWADYHRAADLLADLLVARGIQPGERVGVLLPDSGLLHASYVGIERIGAIGVGLPVRAGDQEIAQLLARTGARALVMPPRDRNGRTATDILRLLGDHGGGVSRCIIAGGDEALFSMDSEEPGAALPNTVAGRVPVPPDQPWFLNFTSGTTGLPKAVVQTQNRWFYLAQVASAGAHIGGDDVVLSAVPGLYGFGLWTAHLLPVLHGAPCCLSERFTPEETLRLVERERVTVLACVTTQLTMMMQSPAFARTDLSSLRAVFTGGERVPTDKATQWEEATGSRVLQFYGSNEAGPFSCTRIDDDATTRLHTAGRVVDGVDWKLLDSTEASDERGTVTVGQAALRSPGAHGGYWEDPAADEELYTQDKYLIMPDIVSIDADQRVRVVGRKSDIIIRGGKNISAAAVEERVSSHPRVSTAVAVPVPDETFGERVGVAVVLREPGQTLDLAGLTEFLLDDGASKETLPERLQVVPEIPLSLGAKADKQKIVALFTDE